MITRTSLTLFLSFTLSKLLFAQNEITIAGKVLADSLFAALPFTNIIFENNKMGIISDARGAFSITIESLNSEEHITFSALGYETKTISADSLVSVLNGIVILCPKPYEIPVVHIEGMTARQIVKKAIDKIPDNFAADTFYSKSFYRQYHKENNFYVRLIEASLFLKSTVEKNKNFLSGSERAQIVQLRRSKNYELNKEEHGDHLFDLLAENPVYHSPGTVLNRKALNAFKFFPDTNENDSVYHIFYFSKNSSDEKTQKGELFIDKKTFAVVKFTKEEQKNDRAVKRYAEASSVPYRWEFQSGKVVAEYIYHDGKMFLASLNKTYTHELYDNKVHSKEYVVTENFELKVDPDFYSQKILPGNFSAVSNLYHTRYPYNRGYWNNNLLPEFVFENSKTVIRDLERKETAEQQFEKNSGNLFADK